jgi:hypothetical protein
MNKEFVSYKQAVALRELEFDEMCFGFYSYNNLTPELMHCRNREPWMGNAVVAAPLKQQVFRWFREKYEIHGFFLHYEREVFRWCIDLGYDFEESSLIDNYEEAENACIDKLIELAKQQDNGKYN